MEELDAGGGCSDGSGVTGDGDDEDEEAGYESQEYIESKEGGFDKDLVAVGRSSREAFGEEMSESVPGRVVRHCMKAVYHGERRRERAVGITTRRKRGEGEERRQADNHLQPLTSYIVSRRIGDRLVSHQPPRCQFSIRKWHPG